MNILATRSTAVLAAMAAVIIMAFAMVMTTGLTAFAEEPEASCPDGGYNPTPTAVEITAVPISVASTTNDYFVLYAEHDLDGATVEIPVLVKRGETGTTTLAENITGLPKESYRVEKYLISDPADVDGDCTDDITELDSLGSMNPVNLAPAVGATDGATAFAAMAVIILAFAMVMTVSAQSNTPDWKLAPTGLTVSDGNQAGALDITWDAHPQTTKTLSEYRVTWTPDDENSKANDQTEWYAYPTTNQVSVTGLEPGATYKVKVRARYDDNKKSDWSDVVTGQAGVTQSDEKPEPDPTPDGARNHETPPNIWDSGTILPKDETGR